MNRTNQSLLLAVCACLAGFATAVSAAPATDDLPKIERPFMLWNKSDVQAIKATIEKEDWAKRELEGMRATNAFSLKTRPLLDNYFLSLVAGDVESREYEKQVITNVCRVLFGPEYEEGRFAWIGSPFRIVNYDLPFRMDFFWDVLNVEERRGLDGFLHEWARAVYTSNPWGNSRGLAGAFLALGTGDKRLIRAAFESTNGFRDYIDGMADGYLSPQGENPDVHMIGGMLLYCRALDKLGMGDIGFGYTGKPSAGSGQGTAGSMRRLMEGYFAVGDPRIDIPGGTPFYGRAAMTLAQHIRQTGFMDYRSTHSTSAGSADRGDVPGRRGYSGPNLRHPRDVFRAPIVVGRLPDGSGSWPWMLPHRTDLFYGIDRTPRTLVGKPEIEYHLGMRSGSVEPASMGIQFPMALELAHKVWPDAGFGYFLAKMDPRDSETYYPSLYWNLAPFPKSKASPPAVQSLVLPKLGMALLRSQEGPEFWDSPAPYAVLRMVEGLGTEIPPSVLSLHSFQAFNRPIYRHVLPGYGMGPQNAGVPHGLTHNTVVVDNCPRPGTGKGTIRQHFDPAVKFVSARSTPFEYKDWVAGDKPLTSNLVTKLSGVRAGVDMERSVALTREYLLDVFLLESEQEHTYDWMIHALGSAAPDDPAAWKPTARLNSTLGIDVSHTVSGGVAAPFSFTLKNALADQQEFNPQANAWSLNVVQTTTAADPAKTVMGPEWYDRKIGARVTMLGEPGTGAFFARETAPRGLTAEEAKRVEEIRFPKRLKGRDGNYDKTDQEATEIPILPAGGAETKKPEARGKDEPFIPVGEAKATALPETGGVVLVAERKAATTMFVALHEPFEKLTWKIEELRRIQQTKDAVAVAVRGKGVDDRIMVRQGADAAKATTLGDGAESFQFTGFAYVRIGADAVTASGDLTAMKVKVHGTPRLTLNGKDVQTAVKDGVLTFGP